MHYPILTPDWSTLSSSSKVDRMPSKPSLGDHIEGLHSFEGSDLPPTSLGPVEVSNDRCAVQSAQLAWPVRLAVTKVLEPNLVWADVAVQDRHLVDVEVGRDGRERCIGVEIGFVGIGTNKVVGDGGWHQVSRPAWRYATARMRERKTCHHGASHLSAVCFRKAPSSVDSQYLSSFDHWTARPPEP